MATYLNETELKVLVYNYLIDHRNYKDVDEYLMHENLASESESLFKELYNQLLLTLLEHSPPIL